MIPSLPDAVYLPYTQYLLNNTTPEFASVLDQYANVKAWWARISSRPSWQKILTLQ